MPSSTLKRSAATLGVLAGLLAAAAPANAQFWQGESLRSQVPINVEPHTPQMTNGNADDQMSLTGPEAPASAMWAWHEAARTGLVQQGTQVGSEGVKANNLRGEAIDIIP